MNVWFNIYIFWKVSPKNFELYANNLYFRSFMTLSTFHVLLIITCIWTNIGWFKKTFLKAFVLHFRHANKCIHNGSLVLAVLDMSWIGERYNEIVAAICQCVRGRYQALHEGVSLFYETRCCFRLLRERMFMRSCAMVCRIIVEIIEKVDGGIAIWKLQYCQLKRESSTR